MTEASVEWEEGRPFAAADQLPSLLGWELRSSGLCAGDTCVAVADRSVIEGRKGIDLLAVAEALDRPAVLDEEAGILALGVQRSYRLAALDSRIAPDFTLPDLEGQPNALSDWSGRKRLLVAFASW